MRRRDLIGSLAAKTLDWPLGAGRENAPARLRSEQFILPERRAFLNIGTPGVAIEPVLQAAIDHLIRSADLSANELPRWGGERLDEFRAELGSCFCGIGPARVESRVQEEDDPDRARRKPRAGFLPHPRAPFELDVYLNTVQEGITG